MIQISSLREVKQNSLYKKGDVFVLCGELFGRGYANGLVDEAKARGMKLVGFTVGRRDQNKLLRPLTPEEHSEAENNLGGKIINVPMEAGFDLETDDQGVSVVEMLKNLKPENWESFVPDENKIAALRKQGHERFINNLRQVMAELEKEIPPGANVHFAHTMAGGIPRAKILLLIANRVFKTVGEKYIPSEIFWNSGVGSLVAKSFEDVTANTFKFLVEESASLRSKIEKAGGEVRYSAYGYHGTEILFDGAYQWQTYTPYQQGHAKKLLEEYSCKFWDQGIKTTVFNCPEIRTNSSDIFAGVELSLIPLVAAFKKSGQAAMHDEAFKECQARLAEGVKFEDICSQIEEYLCSPKMRRFHDFDKWPMENTHELAELMIGVSDSVMNKHLSKKDLITNYLSSLVLKSTGNLIFGYVGQPEKPVIWLGHEIIAKQLTR